LLSVRLTPRASQDRVGGQWTDEKEQAWLSASVTAPPDKGRANAALIDLLARTLGVPRTSISLEAGDTSRLKRLRIKGRGADGEAIARIGKLAGA
jgi:uncharacterized protein YggU (UPF0235/DUF167 family)